MSVSFNFQVLSVEYRAAPATLQARIREALVRTGETRLNALFIAERREKLLANLNAYEAEMLVRVCTRNRNWEDLFRYLWVLPAREILLAIRAMSKAGYLHRSPVLLGLLDGLLPPTQIRLVHGAG